MNKWARRLAFVCTIISLGILAPRTLAASPSDDLAGLQTHVDNAIAQAHAGDLSAARSAYLAFDTGWDDVEDGIRAVSRERYYAIEEMMGEVDQALRGQPLDVGRLLQALHRLNAECDGFIQEARSTGR